MNPASDEGREQCIFLSIYCLPVTRQHSFACACANEEGVNSVDIPSTS